MEQLLSSCDVNSLFLSMPLALKFWIPNGYAKLYLLDEKSHVSDSIRYGQPPPLKTEKSFRTCIFLFFMQVLWYPTKIKSQEQKMVTIPLSKGQYTHRDKTFCLVRRFGHDTCFCRLKDLYLCHCLKPLSSMLSRYIGSRGTE